MAAGLLNSTRCALSPTEKAGCGQLLPQSSSRDEVNDQSFQLVGQIDDLIGEVDSDDDFAREQETE